MPIVRPSFRTSLHLPSPLRNARLLALGICACSDGSGDGAPDVPPLPSAAPLLSCEREVESESTCRRASDCAGDDVCRAADAALQDDRAPLQLTCGDKLGRGQNRDRCAASADCETGICSLSDVCMIPCATSADCLEGQACRRVEAHSAQGLSPVMACARTLSFADDVDVETPKTVKVGAGRVTTLEVPAGQANALVYLYLGCDAEGEIRALRTGAGAEWFALDEFTAGRGAKNPLVNYGAFIPALIPNNPALSNGTGGFEIDLYSDLATEVRLVSVSRAGEHEILDINLYYVGGGEERDAGGLRPGSEDMRAIFDRLDGRLGIHGLQIGELREHDVTGALRDELSVLETSFIRDDQGNVIDLKIEGLDELFALSSGSDDGGINLFLVSDMGDVLGISGGIPGALGVSGTAASGVAVAVDVVGLDELDNVILHEMSHQLGLFHTSELNGFVTEPLADTPSCGPERDENGDGVLVSRECVGAGADNLMFWEGMGVDLSEQQAEILRRSPVLR